MQINIEHVFDKKFVRGLLLSCCAIGIDLGATQISIAGDNSHISAYPHIDTTLLTEFQSDHTVSSNLKALEFSDSYTTMELGVGLHFNRHFSLQAAFTFEPVLPSSDDRIFGDQGLYAEELYLQIQPIDALRIRMGKFNPAFGIGWDVAPGVYGVDFAEDYEITERLGAGIALPIGATSLGEISLAASLYTIDTTELSNSLFTERGRTNLRVGGAGNTERMDSYNISVDVENFIGLEGISLHAAYRHHAKGKTVNDISDENGFAVGINGAHQLTGEIAVNWLSEYAYLDNVGGQTRDSQTYITVGAGLDFGSYNIAASHTARRLNVSGVADINDAQYSISAGLNVYDGWTLDAGYKYHIENRSKNHTIGILLARSFSISID